jgi:hypothetical protein
MPPTQDSTTLVSFHPARAFRKKIWAMTLPRTAERTSEVATAWTVSDRPRSICSGKARRNVLSLIGRPVSGLMTNCQICGCGMP